VTVPVATESWAVSAHAFFTLKALRVTANTRFTLMGWVDDAWEAARRRAEEHELVLVRQYEAGVPS
jgi:allantoicase